MLLNNETVLLIVTRDGLEDIAGSGGSFLFPVDTLDFVKPLEGNFFFGKIVQVLEVVCF